MSEYIYLWLLATLAKGECTRYTTSKTKFNGNAPAMMHSSGNFPTSYLFFISYSQLAQPNTSS